MTSTLDVLKVAKAVIVDKGWVQGKMYSQDGVCMLGALDLASRGLTLDGQLAETAGAMLMLSGLAAPATEPNLSLGESAIRLTNWNDQPGRVKDEVLSLLQRAINILEGKS